MVAAGEARRASWPGKARGHAYRRSRGSTAGHRGSRTDTGDSAELQPPTPAIRRRLLALRRHSLHPQVRTYLLRSTSRLPLRQGHLPAGQWVTTDQYGWGWMPYDASFTAAPVVVSGDPFLYGYYPVYGWRWLPAPWVFGIGPHPWFGPWGWHRYGWYGHVRFGHSWWGSGAAGRTDITASSSRTRIGDTAPGTGTSDTCIPLRIRMSFIRLIRGTTDIPCTRVSRCTPDTPHTSPIRRSGWRPRPGTPLRTALTA